jgi:hypothetical protein
MTGWNSFMFSRAVFLVSPNMAHFYDAPAQREK